MENNNETFNQAFEKTQKSSKKDYDQELVNLVNEAAEDDKHTNITVFMDKNILPNQFKSLKKQLADFKKLLNKKGIESKTICLIPDCDNVHIHSFDENKDEKKPFARKNPFSYNYLLQTYIRVNNRKHHPTIFPEEDHLKPVAIS